MKLKIKGDGMVFWKKEEITTGEAEIPVELVTHWKAYAKCGEARLIEIGVLSNSIEFKGDLVRVELRDGSTLALTPLESLRRLLDKLSEGGDSEVKAHLATIRQWADEMEEAEGLE